MRNNLIEKCPLAEVSDMKKRERGSYDFRSTSNLEIVRWNDNSVVTIGSNAYGWSRWEMPRGGSKGREEETSPNQL